MTKNEKDALIGYLEFHLVTFCDQIEKDLDPDAVGMMYDSAYKMLHDVERSIQGNIDIDGSTRKPTLNKPS